MAKVIDKAFCFEQVTDKTGWNVTGGMII